MDENYYGEFVRRRRKELGLTQGKLAEKLKLSTDYISRIEKGERIPSDRTKSALDDFLCGGKLKVQEDFPRAYQESVPKYTDLQTSNDSIASCQTVDIYNMVEGGVGAEPEWHEPIDRRAIPAGFIKPNIRPVLVRGRSMEPTFKNGAIIGVDQSDKQVIEGEAYAIVLPYSGAAVKRLYPLPDGVLIRSDNKEFPEVKLKKDEIPDYFILGRVCWVVQEV